MYSILTNVFDSYATLSTICIGSVSLICAKTRYRPSIYVRFRRVCFSERL